MGSDVIDIRSGTRSQFTSGVGLIVFLFAWGVTFASLFIAYGFVRVRAPQWPPPGSPEFPIALPIGCTVAAFASSFAYHRGLVAMRKNALPAVKAWLVAACALGFVFLGLQAVTWSDLWTKGLQVGQNAYAGTFYMLTMFHASHVLFAIVAVVVLFPKLWRGGYTVRDHLPIKLTGWFWHFVTGAWVGTFLALYAF